MGNVAMWAIAHPVARVLHYMYLFTATLESRTLNISDIADCPPSENSLAEALGADIAVLSWLFKFHSCSR